MRTSTVGEIPLLAPEQMACTGASLAILVDKGIYSALISASGCDAIFTRHLVFQFSTGALFLFRTFV
jgi:hypothetical protein